MSPRRAHYVLSTHWDREWYQTFQDYRFRLVKLLDRVLAGWNDGRLKGPFQCDGQAIILEDYLEVRPERRAEVEARAREGLLAIGPWYALPDEFLVSGESLVRNLRMGRDVARALGGEPSSAGFVCDLFGHTGQTPQILHGFGIQGGFIWRGSNAIQTRNVIWRGADGSELPCYRFGEGGYCSYAFSVRHAHEHGASFDLERARGDLDAFLAHEAELSPVDPLLLFDGGDHQEWDEASYEVIAERLGQEGGDYPVVHATLDAYLEEMLAQSDRIEEVLEGELREPGLYTGTKDRQWLIPGVLSSRVWIKQANADCQALLCQWAEPLSAWAHAALDAEYPQGYLDVAWRWLIQNHPHDSICGCSIDAVHEDMKFRFHQCAGIADRLTTEATMAIAASVEGDVAADALRIVVFNPAPTPVHEVVDLVLEAPSEWPTFNEFFGYEPKPAFRIYDDYRQELPYQRTAQAMGRSKTRIRGAAFPEGYRTNDVTVSLPLDVPAGGYTTLTVQPGAQGVPTRHPEVPSLVVSERSMANEFLHVTVEPNGTLTLVDLRTGNSYARLLTFEDVADIGDGWFHGQAVNDQRFVSTGARTDVAVVHDGPYLATMRARTTFGVPASFRFGEMNRSDELVPLVVDSLISLRHGSPRVEVETTVHNIARDHRLRVLFPTGADTDIYMADAAFDVVERRIGVRTDNHVYRELEVETEPQQTWTAVYGGGRGLAVVSHGLLESCVRDQPERPIALTLLRATRRTVMTDGEPNGQLQGPLTFRYWVVPLDALPERAFMTVLGQRLAAGLRDAQLRAADQAIYRGAAALPARLSFLSVEGPAVVTSARRVDDALEVRVFNPYAQQVSARLVLGAVDGRPSPTRWQLVDLESLPQADAQDIVEGAVQVSLGPKRILTLRLT